MKILRLGDPHVKSSNLEESESLMHFVLQTALDHKIDRLEILGDLFDTHNVINLRVLQFWQNWLILLSNEPFQTVVLVGNHDRSGDSNSTYSSLHVFQHLAEHDSLNIMISPTVIGPFGYLPYIHDRDEFVNEANKLADRGATFLVSHNTYEGSKYDNGMYAPDGVNPDLLDSRFVSLLSGHVHTKQAFGRVIYPGTARWASTSDANKPKGISVFTHAEHDGSILSEEFISTESVCLPIISLEYREGSELPVFPNRGKINLELIGSSDWITKTKLELKGDVSITTKITDSKKSRARKSGKSLFEFVSSHYQTEKREKLINHMKGLGFV